MQFILYFICGAPYLCTQGESLPALALVWPCPALESCHLPLASPARLSIVLRTLQVPSSPRAFAQATLFLALPFPTILVVFLQPPVGLCSFIC